MLVSQELPQLQPQPEHEPEEVSQPSQRVTRRPQADPKEALAGIRVVGTLVEGHPPQRAEEPSSEKQVMVSSFSYIFESLMKKQPPDRPV